MPEDDPFTIVETALRDRAMTYPGATEEFPWDHRAIKVKGKIFLILDLTDGVLSVTMKLPDSNAYALMQRFAERTGYGLGKSGWVTCRFRPGEEPAIDLLEEWLEESYRAVAPKKLVLALNAQLAGAPDPEATVVKKPTPAKKPATTKKTKKKTKRK
ncbi:MAG: MmcQ/YjbR family DNA-binding protein [Planctomycetia bacterium]|nr:MmcQ/YjbR family DNA-binding protein [Planctomycetia bacterium]